MWIGLCHDSFTYALRTCCSFITQRLYYPNMSQRVYLRDSTAPPAPGRHAGRRARYASCLLVQRAWARFSFPRGLRWWRLVSQSRRNMVTVINNRARCIALKHLSKSLNDCWFWHTLSVRPPGVAAAAPKPRAVYSENCRVSRYLIFSLYLSFHSFFHERESFPRNCFSFVHSLIRYRKNIWIILRNIALRVGFTHD